MLALLILAATANAFEETKLGTSYEAGICSYNEDLQVARSEAAVQHFRCHSFNRGSFNFQEQKQETATTNAHLTVVCL